MDISSWYNNPEYSDLTIELRDGRKIKVHKNVLCTTNVWFKNACGSGSTFAECNRNTLELKDDDPAAIDFVLRYIYSKQPCVMNNEDPAHLPEWRFWLNVHITATKYLVPDLKAQSCERLIEVACSQQALDDTINILDALTSEQSHSEGLARLSNELRNANIKQLLQSERYRRKLESDKTLLWAHVDRLFVATQPVVEERYAFLSPAHTARQVLITNDSDVKGMVYFNYEGSLKVEGNF